MNVMVDKGLTAHANQAFDAAESAHEQPNAALAKLMKAWESKQASRARKAGGFSLMAVSLAACGSDGDGDGGTDPAEVGSIFRLTTDADITTEMEPTGESDIAGDVFNAMLGVGIDGLVGVQTLQEADVIVGTDEVDVLNATLNGTGAGGALAAPTITGVEVLNLTGRDTLLGQNAGLDLSNSTGYTQIWNIGSNDALVVVGVGESAAIGLNDVSGQDSDGNQNVYAVTYTSSADTTVQNVIATAVGTSEATGPASLQINAPDGIETLNLAVSDTVRLDLDGSADDMEVFNITGSGVTQLAGEQMFPNLVSLDSTEYSGDLTLDVSGSADLESVLTAGGDDFITIQDINADGDLVVNLGEGDDVLGLVDLTPAVPSGFAQILQGEEISGWDFTGGVSGVETLSILTDVYLVNNVMGDPVDPADATLNLDGFDGDLATITFAAVYGNDNDFAFRNAPEALTVEAEMIEDIDLDTGNIVDLTVAVNGDGAAKPFGAGDLGELDIDEVDGPALETLTLVNTSTPGDVSGDAGDINLNIDSDADHDVSALQTISVDASQDADVNLDADDADADMNALTSVSVIAGDDADLDMDGVPAEQQEQEFVVDYASVSGGGANFSFDLLLPDGSTLTLDRADFADQPTLDAALAGSGYSSTGLNTSAGEFSFVLKSEAFAPTAPIVVTEFTSTGLVDVDNSTAVIDPGVAPNSFMGLEDVVVTGAESAAVNIEDVYGSFTVDVTANGILIGNDAEVDLSDTNVTEVTVTVNTAVEYNAGLTNYEGDGTGHADIDIDGSGSSDFYGNPFLTTLTVTSGTAEIDLDDDLSSLTTIDLTGVVDHFDVDADGAQFAEGSNVFYLIGGTSSEITNQIGDSQITLEGDGDVREVVTFTEGDFGTVVLNGFTAASADPSETDRIDLSDLGFTNEGQLDFEQGTYDANGVFTSDASGDDLRITDGNLADGADMGGEIIVTNVIDTTDAVSIQNSVEDLQSNIVYV